MITNYILDEQNTTESKGEEYVKNLLDKLNIPYELQVSFHDLKGKIDLLRYDFLINKQGLLEIDGPQHFSENTLFGKEAYETDYAYDKLKNDYAESHDIPLYRIAYINNDFDYLTKQVKVYLSLLKNKASRKDITTCYLHNYLEVVKSYAIQVKKVSSKRKPIYNRLGILSMSNEFNDTVFPKLKTTQSNLFIYILYRVHIRLNRVNLDVDKVDLSDKDSIIDINLDQLYHLLYPTGSMKYSDFFNFMKGLINILSDYKFKNPKGEEYVSPFKSFDLSWYNLNIKLKSSNTLKLLGYQKGAYVSFPIEQYFKVKTPRAKTIYRLIKELSNFEAKYPKSIKQRKILKTDLFNYLHISDKLSAKRLGSIKSVYLNPICTNLSFVFRGLNVSHSRNRRKSNKVTSYKFNWSSQTPFKKSKISKEEFSYRKDFIMLATWDDIKSSSPSYYSTLSNKYLQAISYGYSDDDMIESTLWACIDLTASEIKRIFK